MQMKFLKMLLKIINMMRMLKMVKTLIMRKVFKLQGKIKASIHLDIIICFLHRPNSGKTWCCAYVFI